jgi:hypothetical protein
MAQSYFHDFWIVTDKGETLYPALIKRRGGSSSYRILADGSNRLEDGMEVVDPVEAVKHFLNYKSLRFGKPGGGPDNRFKRGSNFVRSIHATSAFKAANPTLVW